MTASVLGASNEPKHAVYRVLVLDGISEEGLKPLIDADNVDLTIIEGTQSEDKLIELIENKHAVLVRSATKVTQSIISAGKDLLVVGRAGVGVDNIDIPSATKAGVFVVNSPMGNVVAAAEHTVALIYAASRCIPAAHAALALQGEWKRAKFVGIELKGRTLGVLGCGQVGSRVVRMMKATGMRVVVYDPFMNDTKADILQVEKFDNIDDVFRLADILTIHLPKNEETLNMVNAKKLSLMKKGSIVINVARGGILNEQDCVDLLRSDHLRCAAIDVFSKEPIEKTNPFALASVELGPRLILTPHLGASTEEAQLMVALEVSNQCKDVFAGNVPDWAVNKSRAIQLNQGYELDEIAQITNAAEFVGNMIAQLIDEPCQVLDVLIEGDHFLKIVTPQTLSTYAAVGFLKAKTSVGRVNLVNIEQICQSACMEVTGAGLPHERHSEFRVSCQSKDSRIEIRATVSARLPNDVIIRGFCGVPCHMKLSVGFCGKLIYTLHDDVPGILAGLTQCLAAKSINITDCHLARISEDDERKVDTPKIKGIIDSGAHLDVKSRKALALVLVEATSTYSSSSEMRGIVKSGLDKSALGHLIEFGCITLSEE